MRPGYIPPVEPLTAPPVAPTAGSCIASSRVGDGRYIYYLNVTSTTAATFWRLDTLSNAWQQLAAPDTLAGNARFGAGCALIVDDSAPTPLGGGTANVWLFHPHVVAPWAQFQFYNATLNTWTQASQAGATFAAAGLAAQFGTAGAITHPCTTLNPAVSDDFIYVTGNAATAFYRYTISSGTVTAMGVRGGAAGAGVGIGWIPTDSDRIFSMRGDGTAAMDRYTIAGNTWAAFTYAPATETFAAGTSIIADVQRARFIVSPGVTASGQALRFWDFNAIAATMTPRGTAFIADNVPHVGSLAAMGSIGATKYIYCLKHTIADAQRIMVVE